MACRAWTPSSWWRDAAVYPNGKCTTRCCARSNGEHADAESLSLLARESAKEEHLRPIAQGLDLDYNDLLARVQRVRKQPKYVTVTIKDELSPADLAFVDSHHDFFPELVLIQTPRRLYPQNG